MECRRSSGIDLVSRFCLTAPWAITSKRGKGANLQGWSGSSSVATTPIPFGCCGRTRPAGIVPDPIIDRRVLAGGFVGVSAKRPPIRGKVLLARTGILHGMRTHTRMPAGNRHTDWPQTNHYPATAAKVWPCPAGKSCHISYTVHTCTCINPRARRRLGFLKVAAMA